MTRPVIILGGGGHARVLGDLLRLKKNKIMGFVGPQPAEMDNSNLSYLGTDEEVLQYSPRKIWLVNGVGSVSLPEKRRQLFLHFKKSGYDFATLIHPSAVVARDVQMGEGVQIMAGVVIQTGTQIHENVIINTRASVDHDCSIGAHCHLAPGVVLSGSVRIGENCHLGTGAVVVQGVQIKDNTFIKAASLVKQPAVQETAHAL